MPKSHEVKKPSVALAALAATSAFAQSSVTIYGAVDAGVASTTQDSGATTIKKMNTGSGSSYTSRLGFTAVEDLGAGQKAGFTFEAAMGSLGGDTTNNAAFSNSNASGLRTGQAYVTDAKLGTVTAGYGMTARHVQAATLDMTGGFNAAGNLMTAVGVGGFGTTTGGAAGVANTVTGAAGTAGAYTNNDYSLRAQAVSWTSPSYNGLNFVYGHIFNDNNATTDADGKKAATSGANARANLIGFGYAQGPLTLMGSLTRTRADATQEVAGSLLCMTDASGAFTTPGATATTCGSGKTAVAGKAYAPANGSVRTNNIIGGIYDFGVAKVSVGTYKDKLQNFNWTSSSSFNPDAGDVLNRGTQVGVRGSVPGTKVDLVAQVARGHYVTGGSTAENTATAGQTYGVIYNFSKRTSAYGIYGQQTRTQAASSSTNFTGLKDTIVAAGLRHNF
jgi:predicted porin